ncbi:phage protein Gp27 family protein, partial [Pseudoalteromonas sp. MMG012]
QAFAEEAANAVEESAIQAGLTEEGAQLIKNQILGIA